ncbi:putative protein phosphatase 2C 78 [Iris pallida]|uniref:Uncharacterized protein n=1 Tax=Iris pallida TaxID=29817 RepID=A0AAX6DGW2_IRIPA|nr:putative protein phosphatase 2C 78 [Iris pallida]
MPQAPVGKPATPGGDMADLGVTAPFHTSVPSDSTFTPYVAHSQSKLFSCMWEQKGHLGQEMQLIMSTNIAGPGSEF